MRVVKPSSARLTFAVATYSAMSLKAFLVSLVVESRNAALTVEVFGRLTSTMLAMPAHIPTDTAHFHKSPNLPTA